MGGVVGVWGERGGRLRERGVGRRVTMAPPGNTRPRSARTPPPGRQCTRRATQQRNNTTTRTLDRALPADEVLFDRAQVVRKRGRLAEHRLVARVRGGLEVLLHRQAPLLLGLRVMEGGRAARGGGGSRDAPERQARPPSGRCWCGAPRAASPPRRAPHAKARPCIPTVSVKRRHPWPIMVPGCCVLCLGQARALACESTGCACACGALLERAAVCAGAT